MIRQLLIIILAISFGFTASAQKTEDPQPRTYRSMFGKDSTRWLLSWRDLSVSNLTSMYADKDTFFLGHNWKRLTDRFGDWGRFYALREDTLTGKVWLYVEYFGFTYQHLQYDFSLEEGDTFRILAENSWIMNELGTVDSVRYRNGLKYIYFDKMITFSDHWDFINPFEKKEPFTLIEGIGSNASIRHAESDYHIFPYLICTYKDGIQTDFRNKYHSGHCGNPLSVAEFTNGDVPKIAVFPNPAREILIIEGELQNIDMVEIITIEGRVINKTQLNRKSITSIKYDISTLSSGLYIVRLTSYSTTMKPVSLKFNIVQ